MNNFKLFYESMDRRAPPYPPVDPKAPNVKEIIDHFSKPPYRFTLKNENWQFNNVGVRLVRPFEYGSPYNKILTVDILPRNLSIKMPHPIFNVDGDAWNDVYNLIDTKYYIENMIRKNALLKINFGFKVSNNYLGETPISLIPNKKLVDLNMLDISYSGYYTLFDLYDTTPGDDVNKTIAVAEYLKINRRNILLLKQKHNLLKPDELELSDMLHLI